MADEDGDGQATEESQRRKLRLLGTGTVLSGLLTVGASRVFADPYDPVVFGLAFLTVATMAFEYTEGRPAGLSLGFLTGGVIVWLLPVLSPEASFAFTGAILVLFGLLNVVFPPFALFFSNLGRRLARRGSD
ncbi:MAG: hypothetical protein V5A62_17705 [Haloarculaceae archaeon]